MPVDSAGVDHRGQGACAGAHLQGVRRCDREISLGRGYASPEQQKLIELVLFYHEMFRPFIVSREVPAPRLAALRDAFWQMVQDKEFKDDAQRQGREVVAPMKWDVAERIVAEVYRTPPISWRKRRRSSSSVRRAGKRDSAQPAEGQSDRPPGYCGASLALAQARKRATLCAACPPYVRRPIFLSRGITSATK